MQVILLFIVIDSIRRARNHIFFSAIRLLSRRQKSLLLLHLTASLAMALMDLVGIAAIGILSYLAFAGVSSQAVGDRISELIEVTGLSRLPFEAQLIILGLSATFLFIIKTILSMQLSRKMLRQLSFRSAEISAQLIHRYFLQRNKQIRSRSVQEIIHLLTESPNILSIGILGAGMGILSDSLLLAVIILGLFLVDALSTLLIIVIFLFGGYGIYKLTSSKVSNLGKKVWKDTIRSRQEIANLIQFHKQYYVLNRVDSVTQDLSKISFKLAGRTSELAFLGTASKYFFEILTVVLISMLGLLQIFFQSGPKLVAITSIFLVATTRIAPAVMRINQQMTSLKASVGQVEEEFESISALLSRKIEQTWITGSCLTFKFMPTLEFRDVNFKYFDASSSVLTNFNLKVNSGEFVVVTGETGVGKSTLVDLALGILRPDSGSVLLSSVEPSTAIQNFPGKVYYVPQDSRVFKGTVRDNLQRGNEDLHLPDEKLVEILGIVHLEELNRSTDILDAIIEDDGTNLSGGQRQKISLARGIIRKPEFIFLDESTSALDLQTELSVLKGLRNYLVNASILLISHRTSYGRLADKLFPLK